MRIVTSLLVIIACMLWFAFPPLSRAGASSGTERAIAALLSAAAWNRGDLNAFMQTYEHPR